MKLPDNIKSKQKENEDKHDLYNLRFNEISVNDNKNDENTDKNAHLNNNNINKPYKNGLF